MNKISKVGGPGQLCSSAVLKKLVISGQLLEVPWALDLGQSGRGKKKSKTNQQQMESVPELEALPVCISPGLELLLGALFLPPP